jgi:hypothetical protein
MRPAILGLLVLLLASCGGDRALPEANPLAAPPLALEINAEDVDRWRHRQEIETDLDGNGTAESVILASDVTLSGKGVALWEDGHRWVLMVREGSELTLLYSAFVPNGFVEAAVLGPSAEGAREVLIQERTPQQIRALTVRYEGPGRATGGSSAYYQVERWFPGSARLMD